MPVSVFFNRPDLPIPLEPLLDDLRWTAHRLALASAWLTSLPIAEAFIASSATHKAVFLNDADVYRGERKAVQRVLAYFADTYPSRLPPHEAIWWEGVHILGSALLTDGIMHHKFLVMDDRCVWCGSYNFTLQAQRNFELLLRIDDRLVCNAFWNEVLVLAKRSRCPQQKRKEETL